MVHCTKSAPLRALTGLVLVLASACSSTPRASEADAATMLAAIDAATANGDFAGAVREAEKVLSRTDRRTPEGAAVGFDAARLAAQAHWRAANGAPFLREPDAAGVWQPSPTAHAIAATRYFALTRSFAARAAPVKPDEDLAVWLREADLMELSVHARLGLRASVDAFLRRSPQWLDAQTCADAAVRAPLAGRRPWIYAALFDFLRSRDELQAYRFAILAIDEAPSAGREFDPRRVVEMERWITSGSLLEFRCPQCNLPVNPGLRACPNDRTPNFEFPGRKRL